MANVADDVYVGSGLIRWGNSSAPAPATAISYIGTQPSGGQEGVASDLFTIGVDGALTQDLTVTVAVLPDGTPVNVVFPASSTPPNQSYRVTPGTSGSKTLSLSNNRGLTNPPDRTYLATAAPVAPAPSSAYRNAQTYLFQPSPAPKVDPALGGTFDYDTNSNAAYPPTNLFVDNKVHWRWDNNGGDWIDANGVRQGTTHMASIAANAVSGSATPHRYLNQPVTTLVRRAQEGKRWLAIRASSSGSSRAIAGPTHAQPPVINVAYTDGTTGVLACRVLARNNGSTTAPNTRLTEQSLPAFLEFERPTKAVASATMDITVTQHWSGSATINFNLCDPPLNAYPVTGGLAASYVQDAGITGHADVLGAHRYLDGTVLSDFVHPTLINFTGEPQYSPEFWGGAVDNTKLPYVGAGKWIAGVDPSPNLSLVSSSYTGEGFTPLYPGMGALRCFMPDQGTGPGQSWGEFGTKGADYKIFMPPAEFGLLRRLFIRYYVRLGAPQIRSLADRFQVDKNGTPTWVDMAGKHGIAPAHLGNRAVSGGSGGGNGWQMRHSWSECETGQGGPVEGGINVGWHLYDYLTLNPAGHNYGAEFPPNSNWGQKGGLGATLYAGRWYCVEVEIDLNSVDQPSGAGDGKNWTPDGALRAWIDGRLVYERTGMVFRTLPKIEPAYNVLSVRPARDLGITELWFNWFHGGLSPSTAERVQFITGLVWGKSRIGPMQGTPIQLSGTTWTPNVDADQRVLDTDWAQLPLNTWVRANTNKISDLVTGTYINYVGGSNGLQATISAWGGAAYDYVRQQMLGTGGGHGDSHPSDNMIWALEAAKARFSVFAPRSAEASARWAGPSPTYEYGQYAAGKPFGVNPNGNGPPDLQGRAPSIHTYHGLQFDSGADSGTAEGVLWTMGATCSTWDVATKTVDTPHFRHGLRPFGLNGGDFIALMKYPYVLMPQDAFYARCMDLSQREATTYSGNPDGAPLPNPTSRGRFLTFGGAEKFGLPGGNFIYARKLLAIDQKNHIAWLIGTETSGGPLRCVRYAFGAGIDACVAAGSWSTFGSYVTVCTLSGPALGSFSPSAFDNVAGAALCNAGAEYDEDLQCLWIVSNNAGGATYRVDGVLTTAWTVTQVPGAANLTSDAGTLYGAYWGRYGRMRRAKLGVPGAESTILMAVNSVNFGPEFMRVA